MFGFLESVCKVAVGVVVAPAAIVADVVTMGGTLTDKKESYTEGVLSDIGKNISNAIDPNK